MEAHERMDPAPDIIRELEQDLEDFARAAGLSSESVQEQLTDREVLLDHYLERMADLERQVEENVSVARRRISIVEAWLDDEQATLDRQLQYLRDRVQQLVPQTLDAFQEVFKVGKKSRSLPHGTVGFRAQPHSLEVVDEPKALEWAEANIPAAVKTYRSVLKTPIKKKLDDRGVFMLTGEYLEPDSNGLRYLPGQDVFYVKVQADG